MEEDIIENIEVDLPPEQQEHFESLISFLIGTYNTLSQGVLDGVENEDGELLAFIVDKDVFNSVMDSLKDTANNFADILGMSLEEDDVERDDGN